MTNHPLDPEQRHAFLMRFWFEPQHQCWRVHLQDGTTGQDQLFANFPDFVAFLAQRMGKTAVPNTQD